MQGEQILLPAQSKVSSLDYVSLPSKLLVCPLKTNFSYTVAAVQIVHGWKAICLRWKQMQTSPQFAKLSYSGKCLSLRNETSLAMYSKFKVLGLIFCVGETTVRDTSLLAQKMIPSEQVVSLTPRIVGI